MSEVPQWILDQAKAEEVEIDAMCKRFGYGRVMQAAEKLWAASTEHPGSQHTVGPCAAFMVPCVCAEERPDEPGCEWCCGSMRLTKAVKALVCRD